MLRFIIGLGTSSVEGCDLEKRLLSSYRLNDFDIIPIREMPENPMVLLDLGKRAQQFAERMRSLHHAEAYVGIASGDVLYKKETKKGLVRSLARTDVLALCVGNDNGRPVLTLNPVDINWQVDNRLLGLTSATESVASACKEILKQCGIGVPSNTPKRL